MLRRSLSRAILTADPTEGSLRPFLLALLAIMAVPNVSHACAMYIPMEDGVELMAEAPSLEAIFLDIDAAADGTPAIEEAALRPELDPASLQLLINAEPRQAPAEEPTAQAQAQPQPQT